MVADSEGGGKGLHSSGPVAMYPLAFETRSRHSALALLSGGGRCKRYDIRIATTSWARRPEECWHVKVIWNGHREHCSMMHGDLGAGRLRTGRRRERRLRQECVRRWRAEQSWASPHAARPHGGDPLGVAVGEKLLARGQRYSACALPSDCARDGYSRVYARTPMMTNHWRRTKSGKPPEHRGPAVVVGFRPGATSDESLDATSRFFHNRVQCRGRRGRRTPLILHR